MSGVMHTRVDAHRDRDTASSSSTPETRNKDCQEKTIKPGVGADATKGPCKKAKQIRLERKMEKLREKGFDVQTVHHKNKNVEKQLEDLVTEIPEEIRTKLEVRLVRTSPPSAEWTRSSREVHRVYRLYQEAVHGDPPHKCSEKQFRDFLVTSPLQEEHDAQGPACGYGSFQQQYWLSGRLVAVGVLDILPECVSSVYFFYDPHYRFLNFGTYGALREIALTRHLHKSSPKLKYYYMGFYIHSCPKMRYKGNFHPSDLLCPETYKWFPIGECVPKLETSPYSRLNPDLDAVDEDDCGEKRLDSVPLLVDSNVVLFGHYRRLKPVTRTFRDNLLEYARLVGAECAGKLIFYKDEE